MLQQLHILAVTHKRVNLKRIGEFVLTGDSVEDRLRQLKDQFGFSEFLYLATCNRVLYFFVREAPLDDTFAARFFQAVNPQLRDADAQDLPEILLQLQGGEALKHLFEVAASMDSLVIGERQILRQLREAYERCRTWGLTGDTLRLAVDQAVLAAKEVYAHTRIGEKPVSVVSLAIQKMLKLHLPKDARILLLGAGQTNTLVAKFLIKHHFERVTVFNRSLPRAHQLAGLLGGRALPLAELPTYREGFDCLIVCTASTTPVITPRLYEKLLHGDQDKKVILDLAIPHNVAPEVVDSFPVHYVEIEGLRDLAKENLAFREQEVHRARVRLQANLEAFPSLLRQRQIERALSSIPEEVRAVKEKALNEVFRKEVDQLDTAAKELLERMLSYMEKKCIGIPMRAAREATTSF